MNKNNTTILLKDILLSYLDGKLIINYYDTNKKIEWTYEK